MVIEHSISPCHRCFAPQSPETTKIDEKLNGCHSCLMKGMAVRIQRSGLLFGRGHCYGSRRYGSAFFGPNEIDAIFLGIVGCQFQGKGKGR